MTLENDRLTMTDEGTLPGASGQPRSASGTASTAKAETTGTAEAARDVMQEVSDQVAATASTAKGELDQFVGRVKQELTDQGYAKEQQLATGMRTMSRQLSALADGRPEEAGNLANVLRDAQSRLQSYASSLETRGPRAMLDDVSAFARRRPGTFLVLAGVGGFVVGRLVRSGAAANGESASHVGYSGRSWSALTTRIAGTDAWDIGREAGGTGPDAAGMRTAVTAT